MMAFFFLVKDLALGELQALTNSGGMNWSVDPVPDLDPH
jgi:hypothetical protein